MNFKTVDALETEIRRVETIKSTNWRVVCALSQVDADLADHLKQLQRLKVVATTRACKSEGQT